MVVEMSCDGNEGDVSTTVDRADGTQVVKVCRRVVMAEALEGLREAREEIANDRELTGEIRAEILRELDKQIERMGRSSR